MRVFISAAVMLAVVAAGCGSDGGTTTPPTSNNKSVDVFTLSSAFSPSFLQIAQGDTVRFNIVPAANGEGHDVTFDAQSGVPANIKVGHVRRHRGSVAFHRSTVPLFHLLYLVTPNIVGFHVGNTTSRFGLASRFCTISARMSL
jgi:plastocyanin